MGNPFEKADWNTLSDQQLEEVLLNAATYEQLKSELRTLRQQKERGAAISNARIGEVQGKVEDLEEAGKGVSLDRIFSELTRNIPVVAYAGRGNSPDQLKVLPNGAVLREQHIADYDFDETKLEIIDRATALEELEKGEATYQKQLEDLQTKLAAIREARELLENA